MRQCLRVNIQIGLPAAPSTSVALHTIFKQIVGLIDLPHSKMINNQEESKWDLSVEEDDKKGKEKWIKRRENRAQNR